MAAPSVVLLDVNETLSDLTGLADAFEQVGASRALVRTWFAGVLRDGFALTVADAPRPFLEVAEAVAREVLHGLPLDRSPAAAVEEVLGALGQLDVHPDVVEGIRALGAAGLRVVALTNGSSGPPRSLLERAGVADAVEAFLSVEDAGAWKPDPRAYAHAVRELGVEPAQALLVAVHPWDVDGALRAGLQGAYLDRDGRPYPAYFHRPTLVASTLPGLAPQLEQAARR